MSYLSLVDIPDAETAIAEMARVLRPGGALLIANLNSFNTAITRDDNPIAVLALLNEVFEETCANNETTPDSPAASNLAKALMADFENGIQDKAAYWPSCLTLALALFGLGRRSESVADQDARFLRSVFESLASGGGIALSLQRLKAGLRTFQDLSLSLSAGHL